MPPTGPLPRREVRAPEKGVALTLAAVAVFEVAEDEVTMFEVTTFEVAAGVDTLAVVGLEEPVEDEEAPEAVLEVEAADETLALDAPIAKSGVEAKTSLTLPMLTACRV